MPLAIEPELSPLPLDIDPVAQSSEQRHSREHSDNCPGDGSRIGPSASTCLGGHHLIVAQGIRDCLVDSGSGLHRMMMMVCAFMCVCVCASERNRRLLCLAPTLIALPCSLFPFLNPLSHSSHEQTNHLAGEVKGILDLVKVHHEAAG
jgi:hypothetical protein